MLKGRARDLPARQKTLRREIDWSYDLLDEGEKTLFRRLSVFKGSFTFEVVEAVCADSDESVRVARETGDLWITAYSLRMAIRPYPERI